MCHEEGHLPTCSSVTDPDGMECNCRCYIHGPEPIPENCYRICGECGHAFTADELLEAHNAVLAQVYKSDPPIAETDPAAILVCPLCTHDF